MVGGPGLVWPGLGPGLALVAILGSGPGSLGEDMNTCFQTKTMMNVVCSAVVLQDLLESGVETYYLHYMLSATRATICGVADLRSIQNESIHS